MLTFEPATDRIDDFGRVLAYVVRARDAVNVNLRLVAVGAGAPYFYKGVEGGTRLVWKCSPSELERRDSGFGACALERTTRIAASRRATSARRCDAFCELPLPALRAEDVQLPNAVWHRAALVVRVLVLARHPLALGAAERFGRLVGHDPTRLRPGRSPFPGGQAPSSPGSSSSPSPPRPGRTLSPLTSRHMPAEIRRATRWWPFKPG